MSRGVNIAESTQYYSNNSYANKTKPVVFLSHKSEDKKFVEAIGEYLMKAGINIYLDKNDFELQKAVNNEDSKKVTECIQKGIKKSDYILCFVSNKTINSWWVPYEIGYATKADKKISTLVKSNVEYIPDFLKIEEIIDNIEDINIYIKRIIYENDLILMEQKCFSEDNSKDHIVSPSKYHELANYLKINKKRSN